MTIETPTKGKRHGFRAECDRCGAHINSNFDHAGEPCARQGCGGTRRPYVYKGQVARLRITSWTYVGSLGACHYYGKVDFRDVEYELTWRITASEARLLNKGDKWETYKAGDESSRFVSTEMLDEAARKFFKETLHELGCLALIQDGDPARVVAFDDSQAERVARLTALYDEFNSIGGYEGDEKRATAISDESSELVYEWEQD